MPRVDAFQPGELIQVRGRRWLVEGVTGGSPQVHRLVCIDNDAQGERLEVLLRAEPTRKSLSDD